MGLLKSERSHPAVVAVEACVSLIGLSVIAAVFGITHWLAPMLLTHYEHAPELAPLPKVTTNAKHRTGDPINFAIVGSLPEIEQAMHAAGWDVADSLSRSADIAIAKSVLFNRPDSTAPVSPLYLFGRAQDIAFEREVGRSARRRHHVRLWLAKGVTHDGRQVWIGDALFDLRAGISHRGFHPTHHIAPDIDEERDTLVSNLISTHRVAQLFDVTGLGLRVDAHNAEGDRYDTDGETKVIVLAAGGADAAKVDTLPDPPLVSLKNSLWSFAHHAH